MSRADKEVWDNALAQHPHVTILFAIQGSLSELQLDLANISETDEQEMKS